MEEKEKKFTTVLIPVPLFKKIQKRIEGTGFTSVSDYVTFVLREVVAETEEEREEREEPFTKEDEEKIKERLRGLGYL
jgi:Arc/MetJ-type ribon-helix-helix transcriptional regulator